MQPGIQPTNSPRSVGAFGGLFILARCLQQSGNHRIPLRVYARKRPSGSGRCRRPRRRRCDAAVAEYAAGSSGGGSGGTIRGAGGGTPTGESRLDIVTCWFRAIRVSSPWLTGRHYPVVGIGAEERGGGDRKYLFPNQSPGCRQGTSLAPVTAWHLMPGSGAFSALGHFGSTTRPRGRGGESPSRRD
jgi:hypothetical protein